MYRFCHVLAIFWRNFGRFLASLIVAGKKKKHACFVAFFLFFFRCIALFVAKYCYLIFARVFVFVQRTLKKYNSLIFS